MGRGVGSWGMREGEYKHGMESVVVLSGHRALKNCLVDSINEETMSCYGTL